MKKLSAVVLAILMFAPIVAVAADEAADKPETKLNADTLAALALRNIGPSINSGRISDFAVTPGKRHRYFIATGARPAGWFPRGRPE